MTIASSQGKLNDKGKNPQCVLSGPIDSVATERRSDTPMQNAIRFENHFGPRVIEIFFDQGLKLLTQADLEELRSAWKANLKSWHSPYTCIFDCRNLEIAPELQSEFGRLIKFFGQFFMKKIVGFGLDAETIDVNQKPPFDVYATYDEALEQTGLGKNGGLTRDLSSLRSRIQIDNDFGAHVMEISFIAPSHFENAQDVMLLKDKVKNILRQWHTPYSVIININNLTISAEAQNAFAAFERFLKGFFCQQIIGYGINLDETKSFPFKVYRSRHKAAAELEHQGLQSGNQANCSSRTKLNG